MRLNKRIIYGAVIFILLIIILIAVALTPKPVDLCASFATSQGEISCAEAKNTAFAGYPGQILSVNKTLKPDFSEKILKRKEKMVWIIQIRPNDLSPFANLKSPVAKSQTIDTIGVAVDLNVKKILFVELYFKK